MNWVNSSYRCKLFHRFSTGPRTENSVRIDSNLSSNLASAEMHNVLIQLRNNRDAEQSDATGRVKRRCQNELNLSDGSTLTWTHTHWTQTHTHTGAFIRNLENSSFLQMGQRDCISPIPAFNLFDTSIEEGWHLCCFKETFDRSHYERTHCKEGTGKCPAAIDNVYNAWILLRCSQPNFSLSPLSIKPTRWWIDTSSTETSSSRDRLAPVF